MKREEKLEQILEVSLKIFSRYGFKKTTVEDIANELDMTKGNLYLYVKNKRDLYEQTVAHALVRWQQRVLKDLEQETDIVKQFIIGCSKSYEYLSKDVDLRNLLIDDPSIFPLSHKEDRFLAINRQSMDILKDLLQKGIDEKRFRAVNVDQVTEFLYSVYIMFVIKTYVKSEGKSTGSMFQEALDLVLNGLLIK
ncbi:MAG: TetR/AcrR family transcriptional regulator [bacterium]|nr:TetR/AcrR family transcriptional regulator [bacterium]